MLNGTRIVVGISGGIAAYKSADLVSRLRKKGAQVKVVMTKRAEEFITPLTLRSLSGNEVATDMFSCPK
ncbi:MAG: bifunctional 4'-phosphopantothenoylcysteine decarboxylase/phosphopantothenoylcysteine synthetase, partial [Clostridiales bacterium]|nr:bifunctional 4'-phosphopantothenoylcysteine decarboxylase/phosphopantothenoylcysteine synthetase [Clostridiales bacterium]